MFWKEQIFFFFKKEIRGIKKEKRQKGKTSPLSTLSWALTCQYEAAGQEPDVANDRRVGLKRQSPPQFDQLALGV